MLVQELRRQLDIQGAADGQHYLLTIAAPAGFDKYVNLKLKAMEQYLDWFNIMAYDFHVAAEPVTNHQAAMYPNPQDPSVYASKYVVDFCIKDYLKAGISSDKIVLGAPIYGRGWSGVPNVNNGLFQRASGQASGSWEAGVFDYKDLLNKVNTQPQIYKVY